VPANEHALRLSGFPGGECFEMQRSTRGHWRILLDQ
jgi:hypothetical protein